MKPFLEAIITNFLCRYLLKSVLIAAVLLILYGVFSGATLALILVLFTVVRLISIATQGMRGPRTGMERFAEALGVLAFGATIPLDVALYTKEFFSFRCPQGWQGALVAMLSVAAYAYPHRWLKGPELSNVRIFWWAIPFAIALPLLNHAIDVRHPYLNPFTPDHNRLAAERVLALRNPIVAGRHADWVLRYAAPTR